MTIKKTTMTNNEPLKKVWLLTCYPNGTVIDDRVFAEMGEKEISEIAKDIADTQRDFKSLIMSSIESEIREQLSEGETEIHISAEDDSCSEYIIVLVSIDSGCDWSGYDDCEVDESLCKDIRKGDDVYVTLGYYGEAQGIYSAKMPGMREYKKLEVE